jgi:two-component system sensor histidine kinase BaeS
MQVLDNLLANALRHTSPGGDVRLAARGMKDRIRIEVFNTGEPISPEHLSHLFEPFYRVEDARPRESGGSGLGLAIVRGIVAAHLGECEVENTPGGCYSGSPCLEAAPAGTRAVRKRRKDEVVRA